MSDACCGADVLPDQEGPHRLVDVPALRRAAVAGAFFAAGGALGLAGAETAATVAFVAVILVGGSTFVPEALTSLRRGRLGVGLLMTLAAAGAVALGQWGEAASLCFLFAISEGLEGYAMVRTRRGLRALLALAPETATRLDPDDEREVPVADLRVGDRVLVRPGGRIPSDGTVVEGRSVIDTSLVTGESIPVEVQPGSALFAGTVNGVGSLVVAVTATTADNSLARVVHMVEDAQERKGSAQRLAERIARPLVPGILVVAASIAVVGALFGDGPLWLHRALVVLIAAAPCAFAIAVPVTMVASIGAASRHGVLIKGGQAAEVFGRVQAIAFDKTGTLTQNRPEVIDVVTRSPWTGEQVLSIAAAVEELSEHPLAAAIVAASDQAERLTATDVAADAGRGVTGMVDGRVVRLGKPGFVGLGGQLAAAGTHLARQGASIVAVEVDGEAVGLIGVRDELRPEAAGAVRDLRAAGFGPIVMLTGDNRRTAEAVGQGAGIDSIEADLLPLGKVNAVEHLRRRRTTVAMVGDGINDAPALATADVGIAMGALGSDVAIEAADIALLGDDLRALPVAALHARRTMRIVRQNLTLSGVILVTLVPLAAAGVLGLAAVVALHEVAEVLVIANGVRAGRVRTPATS